MSALLAVRNLRVEIPTRRATLVAVDDVSFELAEGEVLGLVGETGAGKSVTGSAIVGLLDPPARIAGGQISLAGRRIDDLPEEAMRGLRGREIGMVFQDPLTSLNPLLTVGRHLTQTLLTHLDISPADARSRALRLLSEVGIPAARERLDAYPHELSGGMRQRVVLALAFSCEPKLVIADEPTTALDVSVQAQVIELLKRMCREHGTAVLLITHDMGVIADTADRIAVMYAGRLAEIGPTLSVLKASHHPYTQGLMASIPSMRRRGTTLAQIEGSMPRLDALPSGCSFHPRCTVKVDKCLRQRPELMPAATSEAACWLAADSPAASKTKVGSDAATR